MPMKKLETLEDILGGEVPAYFTPRQLAKILQCAPSTVRRKCGEKKFKGAFRIDEDGDWRIPSRFFERQLLEAEEHGELAA